MYKQCLKWFDNNLHFFDPLIKRKNINNMLRIKSFSELLFIENMFYPNSAFGTELHKRITELAKRVLTAMNMNNYVLHEKGFFSAPAVALEFSHNNKIELRYEAEIFQKMIANKLDLVTIRTPFRQIDVAYSLEKAGYNSNYDSLAKNAQRTVLGKNFNYIYSNEISTYSITHTIFYLTDMGRKNILVFDKKRVLEIIFQLIPFYELSKNLDILSELIIVTYFLQEPLTDGEREIIKSGISLIASYQRKNGAVPSPGQINKKYKSKEEEFFSCYHTTMVALGASYLYEKQNKFNH